MERKEMPAVITTGGTELAQTTQRVARELETGAIVHLMHIQTGRHRGWLSAQKPPGSEPEQITVWGLHRSVGKVLDRVRDGEVFELYNARERRIVGYLFWSTPEILVRLETSLQYTWRSRSGRTIFRDIDPTATEARPVPPGRHSKVMA
jgi:hypothetical protein